MLTDELQLTIEEMLVIKGGADDSDGDTGSGDGDIGP